MNNKFSYNGVVTLIERVNNKTVSKKYYNNGTETLFEAYARALSGQSINNFIPQYINMYSVSVDDGRETLITNNPIPVMVSYKEKNTDGGEYDVPYIRISVVILKSMVNLTNNDPIRLKLCCSSNRTNDKELAVVDIPNLATTISPMSTGVQLILLWDLYVSNDTTANGG